MDNLSESALWKAVEPVAEFHGATTIGPNTVLAAHIRALGQNPTGAVWHTAKGYLSTGFTFSEAAQNAVQDISPGKSQNGVTPTPPNASHETPPQQWAESLQQGPSDRGGLYQEDLTTTSAFVRRRSAANPFSGHGSMKWFPKVRGPGDLDGTGASRLLGTPNVPLSTVLIRETAQNSWDARLGVGPVSFAVHLRTLSAYETGILRERIFTGDATGLRLRETLDQEAVRVLEVSDRGTTGLGGPVRNDLAVDAGSATNYMDLILNIGAPRDVHLGGGTYGFGKTIAYRSSRVGTVLFWSRSVEHTGIEDRLIGSAIGPNFTSGGRSYTGRHWWGRLPDEGARVEPWTDEDARILAEAVFDARFDREQTGTSMMVIDPDLGGDHSDEDMHRLVNGVIWNLWPKLLPSPEGSLPMRIEMFLEGESVHLPEITDHPILAGFAEALQIVRATQNGFTYSPKFDTQVYTVEIGRPRAVLGHLAISRFPKPQDGGAAPISETASIHDEASHIAWMRHDAELVVRYDERPALDNQYFHWGAVFKPVAERDDDFASSEPPAHDDWLPQSIRDRTTKSYVNVAIKRMRELAGAHLVPAPSAASTADSGTRSVAALADSLSKLVGGTLGSKPLRRQSKASSSSPTRRKLGVKVVDARRGELVDGWRTMTFVVQCHGRDRLVVSADAGAATEAGRLRDPDLVQLLGWVTSTKGNIRPGESVVATAGDELWLQVRCAEQVSVDVGFSVREEAE